ncbi:glycosyltransferase family 4 protein [Desulfogranum marinum]|uniref:glycosyltransferase family 4 protein n=1 Tax=Desulfogranum marinum TaxID=453220 RepID=UPI0019666E07|nr:glycosyltransferase family 4 protein [Desulfogranum marinum]MBM9510882.1 glycosyltransferase family 4 protein [Desulfogranum marinum]
MRVAIVHYHLQPGGVTRIIENGLAALADKPLQTVVITGKHPPAGFSGAWKVVKGLQYEQERPRVTATELYTQMVEAACDALGGMPDLWHVHNHSLGKSTVLPSVLIRLVKQGHPMLLQIHDFAEDGRPANYRLMLNKMAGGKVAKLSAQLYPRATHVHYALLNKRDYNFIQCAGGDPSCLHLLPNPVDLHLECADPQEKRQQEEYLWVYPTRGIRRKNIGEFLLWAAVAPEKQRFATTLGPDNPLERPRYERWKALALELELPVELEMGATKDLSFVTMLRQADALVTTSVAEGFGMAFLEPWLIGRPVTGRILEEITHEFCLAGVKLPWGYHRVDVPLRWLGEDKVIEAGWKGLEHSMAAYGRTPQLADVERLRAAWIVNDRVDFGRLDESFQERVIRRIVKNGADSMELEPSCLPRPENSSSVVSHNCAILKRAYSLKEYGKVLFRLYQHVASSAVSSVEALEGEILLDHFLAPERLHLLRVD